FMINDLFIINEGGQLLYSWHPEGKEESQDDLISGFLTALNNFASIERGEDIRSLNLKNTTITFEKLDDYIQKLTFVATTKNNELIEFLHAIIREIINRFRKRFEDVLNQEFDGDISRFNKFNHDVDEIFHNFGMEQLQRNINIVDERGILKSISYLDPKGGSIYYIYAKHYVNKEKITFLVPLIINSANLLYKRNLNQNVNWILLNTVRNEIMLVEIRDKILLVKQYLLETNLEDKFLGLDLIAEKEKYIKRPKKLVNKFEKIKWDQRLKQVFIVDIMGKIIYTKLFDNKYDCSEFAPEAVSFFISSKKASEEVYNRELFYSSMGGEKIATICMNFNNFTLTMIGDIHDLSDFNKKF
ncbi:MAG: hypothetical protein P8Y97_19895, partial [Candidatus Lokiarchaeota archaeon]